MSIDIRIGHGFDVHAQAAQYDPAVRIHEHRQRQAACIGEGHLRAA